MAAQLRVTLPPKQPFWLCLEPSCPVVYFGADGVTLDNDALHTAPGFKSSADGLLCYCFDHTRSEIARQIEATGKTSIPGAIRAKTRAGQCACEVRNPSGRCCLGEVTRFVKSLTPS